jgi:hypothetical protein
MLTKRKARTKVSCSLNPEPSQSFLKAFKAAEMVLASPSLLPVGVRKCSERLFRKWLEGWDGGGLPLLVLSIMEFVSPQKAPCQDS